MNTNVIQWLSYIQVYEANTRKPTESKTNIRDEKCITWEDQQWQSEPCPLAEDNSYKILPSHPIVALSFPAAPRPLSILSNPKI